MGLVQGLDTVIRAAEILRSVPKILFVFIGDGSDKERVASLATSLGLAETVWFVDRQPMDRMPAYMFASDLLLVHLKHSELSNYIIPTKTMAYLASGRPIVMAMTGAAADLIREARSGITVPPEHPSELASAIQSLSTMSDEDLTAMGKSGQEYLLANFSKEKVISRYEVLIKRMLEGEINGIRGRMTVESKHNP